MNYYYLISQLPTLFFAVRPLIARQEFLEETKKWLNKKESAIIEAIVTNQPYRREKSDVLKAYNQFETQMRNDLGLWRTAFKVGSEHKVEASLAAVVLEPNPLEAEKKLLHIRWKFIEELESQYFFDFQYLALYALKLSILDKFFEFDKTQGKENFERICQYG